MSRLDAALAAKEKHLGKQPRFCYAVTGTCGKTSVCYFLFQLFGLLGHKAAYIGTLGVYNNAGIKTSVVSDLTTLSAEDLHQTLAELHDGGVTHVALEASSHGLDQYRLHGVNLHAIGFTNLSRDHLDYHKDTEDYFLAKKKLFTDFAPVLSVTNADDPYSARLPATVQFGQSTPYYYKDGKIWIDGQAVDVNTLRIIGEFQYWNICCAMAMLPEAHSRATELLPQLKAVPGRFEKIHEKPLIIVDYAHKPDAMGVVLQNLRQYTAGKLITVFGCGGDRDAGKRPLMGQVAHKLSDVVIVTDDNPRFEEPATIRLQILANCPGAIETNNRVAAIEQAIAMAKPEDSIAILGKGSEKYQKIKGEVFPFDDIEIALKCMR
jgi:UDP-N-acetylmuramyl-tripeptide synthetase